MKTVTLAILSVLVVGTASACVGTGSEPIVGDEAAFRAEEGDGEGHVGVHESELLSSCTFRNQIGVMAIDERTACTDALLQADQQCWDQSGLPCCQVSGKTTFRSRGQTWCEYRRYMWTDL